MSDVTSLGLLETLQALEKKEFSEVELNQAYLARISRLDGQLEVFLQTNSNPTQGIPAAIKDIISTRGIKTTAGSQALSNYKPVFDATVITRLRQRNVGILGKTNCDEFAMGSSGENSAYRVTKNPWDFSKVPGGSSSGSASAVAADLCVFSLGTDTGGSIRQPAALCGVVGLKPSYGRVSRYGAIAMASSLDQIGPLTKSVADARLILKWISGEDGKDNNCLGEPFKGTRRLINLKGIRVGVPKEYFAQGLDSGVERVIKEAVSKMEELGARVVEVELPHTQYGVATYYIVMSSEVSSNLARFDAVRFGQDRGNFGAEAKRRIMLGTFALSAGYFDDYFIKAAKVRTLIRQDFKQAFEKCDVIVGPVSPTVAWNVGEKTADPLTMYLSDAYTVPASLAGIPGISVPCGFVGGLPAGLQILGRYMDEETVLNVAQVYEEATNWKEKKPKL